MARYNGPKTKISRIFGEPILGNGKWLGKNSNPPGQHGAQRKRKTLGEYALQLREKQKIKRMYGLGESQFRGLFEKASVMKGITGNHLLSMLERRLDNVVYRSGFANSRADARQLVRHGHFRINGKLVNIPSYQIEKGDMLQVKEASRNTSRIAGALESVKRREIPQWLELNATSFEARVRDLPARDDVTAPMQERMVVELYSK